MTVYSYYPTSPTLVVKQRETTMATKPGCNICGGRQDTCWGKELQVLPECNHAFCLPCLSVAWHHAPSGGQCPLCLTELDQSGSRKTLLDSIPLLSRGSAAKEKQRGAKVLDGAIAKLGDLIEGQEASAEVASVRACIVYPSFFCCDSFLITLFFTNAFILHRCMQTTLV